MSTAFVDKPTIVYPESDGLPMADNTTQFRYINMIQAGLDAQYRHDPNVFVAGDLFWYPVEGRPGIRVAPDVLVVFGRPKGDRGSYMQWEEDGTPPQVVFEIVSPNNTAVEMSNKFAFYQRYGVEEYYVFDPDKYQLAGYVRQGDRLLDVPEMQGYVSPRLGVRFELANGELHVFGSDGERFLPVVEVYEQRDQARRLAEQERQRAEQERQRAENAERRAEELAAQLRQLRGEPPP